MNRAELAALPKGTKLFLISRKVSRSGMRQVFDVMYFESAQPEDCSACGHSIHTHNSYQPCERLTFQITPEPRYVRLHGSERTDFNKRFGVHACGSVDEDRRVGGSYYVNGCGFNRADELVRDLSVWATGDSKHFTCEVL